MFGPWWPKLSRVTLQGGLGTQPQTADEGSTKGRRSILPKVKLLAKGFEMKAQGSR